MDFKEGDILYYAETSNPNFKGQEEGIHIFKAKVIKDTDFGLKVGKKKLFVQTTEVVHFVGDVSYSVGKGPGSFSNIGVRMELPGWSQYKNFYKSKHLAFRDAIKMAFEQYKPISKFKKR
jgi:hypothetical protein